MKIRAENLTEEAGQTDGRIMLAPSDLMYQTGEWVDDIVSGVPAKSRTAANASTVVVIPIKGMARAAASRGMKITAIELYYSVATAALNNGVAPVLYKHTGADGTACATTSAGGTITASLTTTQMAATGQRKLVLTLGTPAFVGDSEFWAAQVGFSCATTSVLKVQGAVLKFTRAL